MMGHGREMAMWKSLEKLLTTQGARGWVESGCVWDNVSIGARRHQLDDANYAQTVSVYFCFIVCQVVSRWLLFWKYEITL